MMKAQNVNPMFQLAEIQVSYRPNFNAEERPSVTSSKDAYHLLISNWDQSRIYMQEQFYKLLLNRKSRVIGISLISTGSKSGTIADPKIIFGIALKGQASSILVAHNHPSENLAPSREDLELTRRLVEAGKLLDLPVIDHLIVTQGRYYSFGDEGLI